MSNDDKKKVVLGSTLALLLGAGSYWFLGSGGGSDSDGLRSSPPGQKAIRAVSTDELLTHKGDHRPKPAKDGLDVRKGRRDPRVAESKPRKRTRHRGNRDVTIKKKKPRPAA